MEKDPFKEYLRESEPDKAHKGYAWSTAIGLQAVDGLKPSKYLIDTAIQNIEGKITMKEAQSLIDSYYEERPVHVSDDERTEEADKVSSRIAEILSETAFSFSPNEYIAIHRKLFQGIYKHAGHLFLLEIQAVDGGYADTESLLPFDPAQINSQSHIKHRKGRHFLFPAETCDHTVHTIGDCKRPADPHRTHLCIGVLFCFCRMDIL